MLVRVQSNKLQDGMLTFDIQFPNGLIELIMGEFLHRPEQPEIANIPITTEDYMNIMSVLSDEELKKLTHP